MLSKIFRSLISIFLSDITIRESHSIPIKSMSFQISLLHLLASATLNLLPQPTLSQLELTLFGCHWDLNVFYSFCYFLPFPIWLCHSYTLYGPYCSVYSWFSAPGKQQLDKHGEQLASVFLGVLDLRFSGATSGETDLPPRYNSC